jgi:MSHA biogenesis protein MshM
MYLNHFGLTEFPFSLTPDTQFYYDLPSHQEALNVLLIALQNGEGFIKIVGDVGTGKTMLCRKLLGELRAPFVTAYIPNPHLSPTGLSLAIADELGISYCEKTSPNHLLQKLTRKLVQNASQHKKTVLIIDEAQAMSIQTLEALRLLTNLETSKQKLLQIVLFGQPELDILMQNKAIRQLRQRIIFSYQLKKLTSQHLTGYVEHRLKIANINSSDIFSQFSSFALQYFSRGVPRLVNIISHKALLSAYGKGDKQVYLKHVLLAAQDTEDVYNHRFLSPRALLLFLVLIAVIQEIKFSLSNEEGSWQVIELFSNILQ